MTAAYRASFLLGDEGTGLVSSIAGTIPATAVAGDIGLLCVVQGTGVNTFTNPTGWTPLRTVVDRVNSNVSTMLWARKLTSGDVGATVTITASAGARFVGLGMVFSDAGNVADLVVKMTATATATTLVDAPAVTTTEANERIAQFWVVRSATTTPPSVAVPSPLTADGQSNTANTASPNFAVRGSHRTNLVATIGSVGPWTATVSQDATAVAYTVAITSAATTVTTPERIAVGGVWVPLRITPLVGPPPVVDPTDPPPPDPVPDPEPVPDPTVPPLPPGPPVGHGWTMWSRSPTYGLSESLPILSAQFVRRHMGVSTAICKTPYSSLRWASLQPSCGVVLYRDGRQEFTGRLTAHQVEWDAESGRAVITVEAKGDAVHLDGALVFPDRGREADDQTASDYWTSFGVATSTAMLRLISDQAGPTCFPARRVPGLTLGNDPGAGPVRTWKARYEPHVLGQLQLMSVASGSNLGLRIVSESGGLEASIYKPRDLASSVKFSADLSNLVGFTYRAEAPTVTDAVAAGQGDLHARVQRRFTTLSAAALSWGVRMWSYVDRRDTADTAELLEAATDEVTQGDMTVSLAVKLTDSQAATYGRDWGLGDRVTVYVGLPVVDVPGLGEQPVPSSEASFGVEPFGTGPFGEAPPAPPSVSTPTGQRMSRIVTVVDVVREIEFVVDESGAETITPAIGTFDAKATIPAPTQKTLSRVGAALASLIARK